MSERKLKNKWHQLRAQMALRSNKVSLPKKYSLSTFAVVVATTGVQLYLCYLSTFMPLWGIVVVAYTAGAFLSVYIFSNCHEICHNLIHPMFKGKRVKNILLRFASLPDISSGNYFYYKWGHIPHHRFLGEHSIAEIMEEAYEKPLDLDPITHLRNLYLFKTEKDGEPTYRFESIRNNKRLRLVILFLMPLIDSFRLFIVIPSRIKTYFSMKSAGRSTERITDALSQDAVMVASWVLMYFSLGNLNFLLYLYLSHLFFRGFMHPYLLLWMGIHKAGNKDNEGRQLTSSIYAPFAGLLSGGLSYHIEHHDFPGVPRNKLSDVHESISGMYQDCFAFRGYGSLIRYLMNDIYDHHYHVSENT